MQFSRSAKIIAKELEKRGVNSNLQHADFLDIVAKANGYKDYEDSTFTEMQGFQFSVHGSIDVEGFIEIQARTPDEAVKLLQEEGLLDEFDITVQAHDDVLDMSNIERSCADLSLDYSSCSDEEGKEYDLDHHKPKFNVR